MALRSNARNPSSLACIPCRQRHLKCDARLPICSRCDDAGLRCHYVASKRGLRKKTVARESSTSSPPFESIDAGVSSTSSFCMPPIISSEVNNSFDALLQNSEKFTLEWLMPEDSIPLPDEGPQPLVGLSDPGEETRCVVDAPTPRRNIVFDPMIKLYYKYFHASHPFILPHIALGTPDIAQLLPPSLISVMQWIGAHFHPVPSARDRYQKAADLGINGDSPSTGFKVQTMLLAAIVNHSHCNEDQAGYYLQSALDLANQLGMQSRSFASQNSFGKAILEESWRRTFWELYIVAHLFKSFAGPSNYGIRLTVYQGEELLEMELPCDETIYFAADTIPKGKTLSQLQNSWRGHDDYAEETFSSFSHRIEATRLWGMVQSVTERENAMLCVDEVEFETLDARLASLMIRLTRNNRGFHNRYDVLEYQMKSQSQMITFLAILYLHYPQSNLRFGLFHNMPSCIRSVSPGPPSEIAAEESYKHRYDLHSLKALRTAGTLLNMITTSVVSGSSVDCIKCNTPFMICALAMSIMVQVVAAQPCHHRNNHNNLNQTPNKHDSNDVEIFTSRIELGIRAMDIFAEAWPLAYVVKDQLLGMMRRR